MADRPGPVAPAALLAWLPHWRKLLGPRTGSAAAAPDTDAAGTKPRAPSWRLPGLSRLDRADRRPTHDAGRTAAPDQAAGGRGGPPTALPLPVTSVVVSLLLLLPAIGLWRMPRPRAVGLEQLLSQVSLLQSFPPTPERPLPALWRERLADQAEATWRRQRGPWWQLWSLHTDSPPLLAISASSLNGGPTGPLPAHALKVGDLIVIAPDPLSRLLLRDRLLPQQRLSRGLNRRCLERLRLDQAVLWSPAGMGVISGPLAPLLQRYGQGCLSLSLAAGGVIWDGEAGDREGLYALPGSSPSPPAARPLPAALVLEIAVGQGDQLLEGLLNRPLIRDPLASRYGLDASRLALVRRSPMRLRLRPLRQGAFQAALELQVPVAERRDQWQALLERLSRSLLEQGLSPLPGQAGAEEGSTERPLPAGETASGATDSAGPQGDPSPAPDRVEARQGATWHRPDGVVVGGWRWLGPGGRGNQLLFFLGPPPPLTATETEINLPGAGELQLRARPAALSALGLLPAEMPELVRRADQLWIVAQPPRPADGATALSRLTGGLRLAR